MDVDLVADRLDVERIAALARDHCIEHGYVHVSHLYETTREIAADKSEATGYKDVPSGECVVVMFAHLIEILWTATCGPAADFVRCDRNNQRPFSSITVARIRETEKNCDLPT